ncbi:MAG: hypothetical protein E6G24_06660 [Actinobacteria bacterium]|nr:MAG: hypothetical protein E6G24_06660 [Actinomycetota bacterium]
MEFQLLGPLEVRRDDGPLPVRGPKQRALLVLLLLHANETLSRERLIDELWGERPPATAPKALQVYVSQLRKLLEPARLLETTATGYMLRLEPGQLDLHRFETLLAEGRSALGDGAPGQAAHLLAEALSLWRGPALADLAYEPFAQTEIARLEELHLAAIEERIEAELQLGHHAELTGQLEPLVTEHPLREHLRSQLMRALYRSGRQAEALEAYHTGRRLLVDELGIEPGRELRELEQAILRQDPALEPAAMPSAPRQVSDREAQSPFVGREQELQELLGGLERAVGGRGVLYLLVGEPGIGKSRLAEELVSHARQRGAQVLIGRCWEAGGAPAYWPWVQALRVGVRGREPEELRVELGAGAPDLAQLLPEIRELLPELPEREAPESDWARFRLFDAASSFLRATSQGRPLVLVLDDMHAADEPSLLLLRFLARELADSRLLVIAAYRDVDPTLSDMLASTLTELRREPVTHRVALEGLPEPAVAEYIEAAAGRAPSEALVDAIQTETEGNPLFVGEVVRLLVEEGGLEAGAVEQLAVPEGIREVIGRRLRHLSAPCFDMLTLASVLGREFDLEALEAVSGSGRDQLLGVLDEAMGARVVAAIPGAPGRVLFEHALIRDTAYDSLTSARRAQLHHQVGNALEDLYAADSEPHLAELAHHFFAALPSGDREKALGYAIRAAERSVGQLAFEEAARLYEMALTLVEDDIEKCELLLALGEAYARAGDMPAWKRAFREAAELADARQLPNHLGRAAFGYGGRILWAVSRDDQLLISLIERALDALGDEESALRVGLLARLAGGPLRDATHPPELKRARSEEAVAIARRIGDPATLAYALAGYTQAHLSPDRYTAILPAAEECVAVALEAGDKERALEGYEQLFLHLLGLGDGEGARANLREMAQLAQELRQPPQHWLVAVNQTLLALLEGRFDDAEGLLGETLKLGRAAPRWNAVMSYGLQLYLLRRGQGRLNELAETLEADLRELTFRTYPIVDCVLTRLYDEVGREDEARTLFDRLATDDFAQIPFDEEWLVSLGLLTEVAHSLGDRRRAGVLLDRLSPYADQVAVAYPEISMGSVSRYLGLLATTLSRWEVAERHFEDALAMNERIGTRPWLAHTQEDYGRMLLERGRERDRARASELLDLALRSYEALGMESSASRISALR